VALTRAACEFVDLLPEEAAEHETGEPGDLRRADDVQDEGSGDRREHANRQPARDDHPPQRPEGRLAVAAIPLRPFMAASSAGDRLLLGHVEPRRSF
jgi:hypothetical protein